MSFLGALALACKTQRGQDFADVCSTDHSNYIL